MSYSDPPPPPPQQPPGGYGNQPPPYGAASPGTNKKAIWSLVLGILSLCLCGLFAGIPAIILSRSAKSDIAATGQGGSGMATAGLVLGIISLVFSVITVILYLTGALTFDGSVSTS